MTEAAGRQCIILPFNEPPVWSPGFSRHGPAEGGTPNEASQRTGSWSQCMSKCDRGLSMNRPTTGRSHQSADRPFYCTDCNSQIRMTNDEIRRNDEIRMPKPATAQVSFSTFGLRISFVICHSSFNDLCNSGSWSQCMRRKRKAAFHEPTRL